MKLYYTKSSPYALCVRILVSKIVIEDKLDFILTHPFNNQEDFLQANPLGKVPCLIDSDQSIVDSEVICDYLDANYNNGELFNPIYADWRLKSLYSICSGLMDACVLRRMESLRKEEKTGSEFWWQRHTTAIQRSLLYIEKQLEIIPNSFSILHINLLSNLSYLNFRHQDIDWQRDYPLLKQFYQSFSSKNCVVANTLND